MTENKSEATFHGVEVDEGTDPDPATIVPLEEYDENHTAGAPTRDELAADQNLYPEGTPDEVLDGTQPADQITGRGMPDETGDHE